MKILFVCSKNRWRSLTAEKIFNGINGHEVRSAGTEKGARIKITEGHIGWAEIIFVMEKKHLSKIRNKYSYILESKKIINLNILDEYEFMDESLIELLKDSVLEYF